ncbi:PH domain-containing protein [Halomarina ordinaria]|uniref:PH domain-containing protein n=1 Tax=Halomarina ordinaria TaxID=3033939 RepID=A0ABD5UA28_9EURY|nr:PH domain-containing protein [Halomarina sp. PSRA2]
MRLHPLTAVVRAVRYGFNAGAVGFFLGGMAAGTVGTDVGLVFVLGPLLALLGAAYGLATYLRFTYELTDDTLDVASGVVGRQEREIPLRRVQNVDVVQGLFKRPFGLAVVRVETAGGGSTEAVFDFVSETEAERLRTEVRRRARDTVAPTANGAAGTDGDVGEPPDERDYPDGTAAAGDDTFHETVPTHLFELTTRELAVLAASSFRPGALAAPLFLVFSPVGPLVRSLALSLAAPVGGPRSLAGASPDALVVLALVSLVPTVVVAWLASAALTVVGYYGFRLGRLDDDLVYERGLFSRYSGSVPLSKVQTVAVTENPLARRLGYAGLAVETAGYGTQQAAQEGNQSVVPLADRERVTTLARRLEGVEEPALDPLPERARRRYAARGLLAVLGATLLTTLAAWAVDGFSLWYLPLALLPVVPLAAHYTWVNRGYALADDHVVVRSGFWRRATYLVPYDRLQTVQVRASVFQRRLGLANVVVDTASSARLGSTDATVFDVDRATATDLARTLRERLQRSLHRGRRRERPVREA